MPQPQSRKRPQSAMVWTLIVSVALTLLLYGSTLGFPYLFDDIIHLRWLQDQTVLSPWITARHMQHYRPLVTSLWALSEELLGPHNPLPLHAVTLLLHIANGCLVGWLASRLIPRRWAAPVAAALFVTFPFSYQAMPSPGSQSKPASAFLLLLACALYWHGRVRHRPAAIGWAALLAALAPFAYESAIVSGGYLLLTELALVLTRQVSRLSRRALLWPLIGVPFLIIWRLVPSDYEAWSFPGWEALWQNATYFAQGLMWPLALLAKPLMAHTGLSDGLATALVSYAALLLVVAVLLWRKQGTLLVVALGWFAFSLGVQWATLPFSYVISGPRLLYTAAVGAALLWAALLASLPRGRGKLNLALNLVAAIGLLAMLGFGARFALQRMGMCAAGLEALEQAARETVATAPDERVLLVNTPAWITVEPTDFALGHEGYTLLPPYYSVTFGDYVDVNHGVRRESDMVGLPDIRQLWIYNIGYHGQSLDMAGLAPEIRKAQKVLVLSYGVADLSFRDTGGMLAAEAPDEAVLARFGDATVLERVAASADDAKIAATLIWRAERPLDGPYTVFVHVYRPDGSLASQADGFPLGGTSPMSLWEAGDRVRDVRYLALPEESSYVGWMLGVGIYHSETGERAQAVDVSGALLPDASLRLPLDELLGR